MNEMYEVMTEMEQRLEVALENMEFGTELCQDDIDVIRAAQAVIGNNQQAVGIRWQINARNLRAFVDNQIEKAWVLMCKAVVILSPHV